MAGAGGQGRGGEGRGGGPSYRCRRRLMGIVLLLGGVIAAGGAEDVAESRLQRTLTHVLLRVSEHDCVVLELVTVPIPLSPFYPTPTPPTRQNMYSLSSSWAKVYISDHRPTI